jgi:multimeric flavodoxin WrbA
LVRADAVILGSSPYSGGLTLEMKSLIDRAGIVSGANGGYCGAKQGRRRAGAINRFFFISAMAAPGSVYWNMGFGLMPGGPLKDTEGWAM